MLVADEFADAVLSPVWLGESFTGQVSVVRMRRGYI